MGYTVSIIPSLAQATTATLPITPWIDVRDYESVCLTVENSATGNPVVHLAVQASMSPAASAANQPPTQFDINTATWPYGSAVGNTAVIGLGIPVNPFIWIRVVARTTTSATAGLITTRVGGPTRR